MSRVSPVLVGRAAELATLNAASEHVRRGAGRAVFVVGPAGIGKTRLARELGRYLDGLVETVYWHVGRSPAYGNGITFWALGEMVRARAGLLETDDETTTRAKLSEMLLQFVPDEAERRWIGPALFALLGIEARVASSELFAAWRTFFERLARVAPVVMVFEDHHHADTGLLDFIDHLLEWSRDVPLCVITLARPELLERRPDWAVGKRDLSVIHLEPLPAAAMGELIRGLVPGLPDEAVDTIVGRAEGVPLYAVETIRMLLADGRLMAEDGAYRPAGDLSALAVPESLTALISSRLDGLDAVERSIVSDAAVLGLSFTVTALAAVSQHTEAELQTRLRTLVRLELLAMEVDPRSPERGQYAFVQALIREVAYGTLSRKAKKARHLAAARYFEGLGSEELAGALAGHYLAAHQNATAGQEADALAAQARVALRGAADRASALGSHEQAVGFLQQAMTVTTDAAELAALLEAAGVEATAYQRFAEAEAFLRDALERREAIGQREPIVRTTTLLAMAIIRSFRFERVLQILEEATSRFADMQGDPGYAGLEGQLARVYMLVQRNEEVLPIIERVLEVAERDELTELTAGALITKGTTLDNLGRHFEGVGLIEAGRRMTERYGHWALAPRAINNLASVLAEDDPRAALAVAREGLELNRRIGERAFTMLDNAVYAAIRVGEWDWALEQLEATAPEETDAMARGAALSAMHQIRAFRGLDSGPLVAELESLAATFEPDIGEAFMSLVRAYSALASEDLRAGSMAATRYAEVWPQGVVEGYRVATRAALWARDVEMARDGLAAFERQRQHGGAVHMTSLTFGAGIAALEGRTSDALTMYRDALRGWQELELPWDEALAVVDMAMTLGPDEPALVAAAPAARTILERLGAKAILDRLEDAMSQRAKAGGRASAAARTREGASV